MCFTDKQLWVYGDSQNRMGIKMKKVALVIGLVVLSAFQAQAFDERQLMKFKALNKCENCDLSKANLSYANLSKANLLMANLLSANLLRANLRKADLFAANLSKANLSKANLSDAILSDANLWGADLRDANLSGANLSNADLRGADLSNADLKDVKKIENAVLCKTKMPWGEENSGCNWSAEKKTKL